MKRHLKLFPVTDGKRLLGFSTPCGLDTFKTHGTFSDGRVFSYEKPGVWATFRLDDVTCKRCLRSSTYAMRDAKRDRLGFEDGRHPNQVAYTRKLVEARAAE